MASGQTINDRILAAKHSIAGQGLAKAVCKATTEELIAPKRKHLDCECDGLFRATFDLQLLMCIFQICSAAPRSRMCRSRTWRTCSSSGCRTPTGSWSSKVWSLSTT